MKRTDAVDVASCCTRADRTNTIASCAMNRVQNNAPFVMMVRITDGEAATNQAVAAVIASPPHIQAYTSLRNALACSARPNRSPERGSAPYGVDMRSKSGSWASITVSFLYAADAVGFLAAAANIRNAHPYRIKSMPMARPMNHRPDAGHWTESMNASAIDASPDATLHRQLGNCSSIDPNVVNRPPSVR